MLKEVEQRQLGLLMVTHNRALADRVCQRVVELSVETDGGKKDTGPHANCRTRSCVLFERA